MKTKFFILFLCAIALMSCRGKNDDSSEGQSYEEIEMLSMDNHAGSPSEQSSTRSETRSKGNSFHAECQKTIQQVEVLQSKLSDPQQYSTQQGVDELQRLADQLSLNYNAAELDSADLARAQQVDALISDVKQQVPYLIQQNVCNTPHSLILKPEEVLSETSGYPVYMERGDKLLVQVEMENPADIRIYNTDSRQLLKSYTGKKLVKDSLNIKFSAVYLLEINPKGRQYASIDISYKPNSVNRAFTTKTVETREVEGQEGDFRVKVIPGIKMQNLFEEPRKFTLRSQLKATFSGTSNSDRATVAIQVPDGAKDVLYSLRISTNEGSSPSDGHFSDNLARSYKKVKFLGIPLYERSSSHSSGLIELLLGENPPPREEEAYINMFVFYSPEQARKFQEGKDPLKLQYSLDYSTVGTQSCNGRIPTKGNRTIYMGYQNERVRYNNYVWLEAVSAVPHNEYLKKEYVVH